MGDDLPRWGDVVARAGSGRRMLVVDVDTRGVTVAWRPRPDLPPMEQAVRVSALVVLTRGRFHPPLSP